ncbi:MAG: NAD(P)/FAD-dependent oxidoreductase [Thermoplasmata archaeon]
MAIPGFGSFSVRESNIEAHYDVAIIGAGPAGLSAAIYSKRAGLNSIVLDKYLTGGLVIENPLVENYLSHKLIKGEELANLMKAHAKEYATILENVEILDIKKSSNNFEINTHDKTINAAALILATGTTHRKLNVEGEDKYLGKGVSYCVTCDAYFFRGKKVAVIGGANSGAVAALYLKNVGVTPVIFEYMPRKMCEYSYIQKLEEEKIEYNLNVQIKEIMGDGSKLTKIRYTDRTTNAETIRDFDGVFIYVGLLPQNDIAKKLGLNLDAKGYIMTDKKQRTSVPKIYAAGDITGNSGQIIISAGQGALAALSAYEDIKINNL